MRRTLTAAAAAALALGLVAGPAAAGPPERTTIVDIASSLTDGEYGGADFDILVDAVVAQGFDGLLDGRRQFTVFAPTDDAFLALFDELGFVPELDSELVRDVLLYHVAPGERLAADVVSSSQINTLNGAKIQVDGTVLDGEVNIVAPNAADVDNGVIHVIDAVLLP